MWACKFPRNICKTLEYQILPRVTAFVSQFHSETSACGTKLTKELLEITILKDEELNLNLGVIFHQGLHHMNFI